MTALVELWTFATAWYNWPYSLALLAFLALSALQFLGLGSEHETDADADVHLDVDHELDLDHDLDVDHELDLDHDASMEHEVAPDLGHAPAWAGVLQFLGVGQAPVTMVLLILLGSFGVLGWVLNSLVLDGRPAYSGLAVLPVFAIAAFSSAWITRRAARFIGRALPAFASTATSVRQLVGRRGYVTSPTVDGAYGQVKVRDPGGTSLVVFAVVDSDKPSLPRDTEVFLVDYDPDKKVFVVVPSD